MSRWRLIAALCAAFAVGTAAPAAGHDHGVAPGGGGAALAAGFENMTLEFSDPTGQINSDIAFWGDKAVVGNYGGFRIYDISDPDDPVRMTDFLCYGPQNDPSLYDTDGNGEADLLILSVDRTLPGPECTATEPDPLPPHDEPTGWEGLRLFDISDPSNPQLVKTVYQDCGSHTNTLIPQPERGRVLVLVSSYPLRAGPTCGPVRGPEAGRDPHHGVIQVVEIDLLGSAAASAASAEEIAELPINYPGDPDNTFRPSEHGLVGPDLLDGLRACHDIAVFTTLGLVSGACAEQSQLWRIDESTGLPDTSNPVWVFDQRNIDFHHSATFTWDGKVVNIIDESFGSGCPTVTQGIGQTGRMYFLDTDTGSRLSSFMIKRSHKKEEPDYCSAHLGTVVPSTNKYLLVNAWYTGGVDVIDFSDPRRPREVAFWDDPGDNWTGYWYERTGTGPLNVFGTHGVEDPPNGQGFQAFLANVAADRIGLDHLNPQVQEQVVPANVSAAASRRVGRRSASRTAGTDSSGRVKRRKAARRLAP